MFEPKGRILMAVVKRGTIEWHDKDGGVHEHHVVESAMKEGLVTLAITAAGTIALQDDLDAGKR